jgi:hypothetical protein
MSNSPTDDNEFVSLDDLALELCSGASAALAALRARSGALRPGPAQLSTTLGPPTAAEVNAFLRTRPDPKNPEFAGKGFRTYEHAMSVHCTASITQGALGLLRRMAGR